MGWNRKIVVGILIFFILAVFLIVLTGNFSKESLLRPWYQTTESLGGVCELISGEDQDHCYQYIARFSGNAIVCGKIEEAGPRSKMPDFRGRVVEKGELV